MNYYDVIGTPISATIEQIQVACDSKYDEWRRLVNHHEAAIQTQAQQALQTIETIRQTLLDPSRRAAYDTGLGLTPTVGGLTDLSLPSASPALAPPSPNATAAAPGPQRGRAAINPWSCPNCGADNAAGTHYCPQCRTQLVRSCPACGKETSLIATGNCTNCGAVYDSALRSARVQAVERQISDAQARLDASATLRQRAEAEQTRQQTRANQAKRWLVASGIGAGVTLGLVILSAVFTGAISGLGASPTLTADLATLLGTAAGLLVFKWYSERAVDPYTPRFQKQNPYFIWPTAVVAMLLVVLLASFLLSLLLLVAVIALCIYLIERNGAKQSEGELVRAEAALDDGRKQLERLHDELAAASQGQG
jgi:hypothetical protein